MKKPNKNVYCVYEDQTAHSVQSDLNLHWPQKLPVSSSIQTELMHHMQNANENSVGDRRKCS